MLYRDTLLGTSNFKVIGAEWNGSAWTTPRAWTTPSCWTRKTRSEFNCRAAAIWFTWQVGKAGPGTDTMAQMIGGVR